MYVYKPVNGLCSVLAQLLFIYGKNWLAITSSGEFPKLFCLGPHNPQGRQVIKAGIEMETKRNREKLTVK